MVSTCPDTVGQDTTAQSTMGEGLIEAKLISRKDCQFHWVITLNQSGKCIKVDLSKNAMDHSEKPFPNVIDSIGFRIKNGKHSIDELLRYLWIPEQFMPPRKFCVCVQWVWGVIYNYSGSDCIEAVSTDGISISQDGLVRELIRRQLDALAKSEMALAPSELACTEDFGSQEIRSTDCGDSHPGAKSLDAGVDDGK